MVVDMANFEASLIPELFEHINKKKHRLLIIANKIDALPEGFDITRL